MLAFVLACTMVLAGCKKEPSKPEKVVVNSLTGELGKKSEVLDKRIVGIVVENHPEARPQWGINDENYSPDVILQAEVEGGITRTLWLYADYTKVPEKIGPMRSARPPFVRFASLFNAIFIHWGMSESGGSYTGADHYFNNGTVDHIDAMIYGQNNGIFGRAEGTGRSLEHTGILIGNKLPELLDSKDFSKDLDKDKTTALAFNRKAKKLSDAKASSVDVSFSSNGRDTLSWNYNKEDKLYHTSHFETDVTRTNLLILQDNTNYITKNNYVTYCDYALKEGSGKLISNGTVIDIKWANVDGKLKLTKTVKKDDEEKEEEIKLNPGKTWIGWISANNGGNVSVTADSE